MKYWDNGFPPAIEDAPNPNSMTYWDNGFPYIYIGTPTVAYTLKLRNGLARASIKTINGLAIASLKERNGLT